MAAIDPLFMEHWNKLAPGEPATAEHFDHFRALQQEYPLLPAAELVAYTLADSLFTTWDEEEA